MKNWINRFLSGSDEKGAQTEASAGRDDAHEAKERAHGQTAEINAVYYRWLTASAGRSVSAEIQQKILDEVRGMTTSPGEAEGLVPRVPGLIPRLLDTLRDDGASTADLSRMVAQDLVLAADVIREANTAYYQVSNPIQTIEAAIMMLGQNGLRMLLTRVAFRSIIKTQPEGFVRHAGSHIWGQSEKCAFAAALVAPGLSAGVFESYLAGLMQNVGFIVALRVAERECQNGKVPGSSEFGATLLACGRDLSASIARHWDFPEAVAEAIENVGDPGDTGLAKALSVGDRLAKLRVLLDADVLAEDDELVTEGLTDFQRRCLGKLYNLEG